MIYLDNSATSPIDEEVRDAMLPYLNEEFGNPSSKYYCKAINAKKAVEDAREKVAKLLCANPDEIIFTAGATESTNFIIKGYLDYRKFYVDGRNHIITSLVEHKATLNTCRYLNGELYSNNDPTISLFGGKKKVNRGYEASFVGVNSDGEIDIEEISSAIKDNTALVSMLYVNNEIGTISDVESVAEICKKNNIALHADLTQALGKSEINVKQMGIDYASCSAHKIYGPKGIGAAFMKADAYGIAPITAFMHGGEQEFGFRAGTHAVHNIVGFGKAAEIALRDLKKNKAHIKILDDMLIAGVSTIDGIHTTVDTSKRLPGIVSLVVDKSDFHNERFIKKVSEEVALSTGSACSAGEPSYVIQALGLADKVTKVLRVSINKYTTEKDIEKFIRLVKTKI
ncbi:aminotransferase, class V [Lachnospiraceae bacterium oral taxon 082 str. F0431]|nr:aminotransferase, class V [Lachnospiraceae bacterium oral taxon 082 str. F0431]